MATNQPKGGKAVDPKLQSMSKEERRAYYAALRTAEKPKQETKSKQEPKHPLAVVDNKLKAEPSGPMKSKADLKAERRAIQEAQREAKLSQKQNETKKPGTVTKGGQGDNQSSKANDVPKTGKSVPKDTTPTKEIRKSTPDKEQKSQEKIQFFSHLRQYNTALSLLQKPSFARGKVHPSILRLGIQYAEGIICGSNARCVAVLHALKQMIMDYTTPENKELSRDLDEQISPCVEFLRGCRPLSVSMESAVNYVKWEIRKIESRTPEEKAKQHLTDSIDSYLNENVILADKAIVKHALGKINNGDVVLIFAHSFVINQILLKAWEKLRQRGESFSVVIVDSRPKMEGKKTLVTLAKNGVKCAYVLLNALSYIMQKVTKVFLGAHALLANGYVMSRVGSSQVALMAKAYNVPVLVCCETHKFSERIQTDSFVSNELGNPDDLVLNIRGEKPLDNWQEVSNLSVVNLIYDLTPPDFVSAVVTELGLLPCTSVPVVLRRKQYRV